MTTVDIVPGTTTHTDPELAQRLADIPNDQPLHIVFIGTKPDIIKQYPLYARLRERNMPVLLCHTGQHTDYRYSQGMLDEFGMTVDVRMVIPEVAGLGGTVSAIVTCADVLIMACLKAGLTPIPYVHGDTSTSMAVTVAAYSNRVACAHVEAGIRTITPSASFLSEHLAAFETGAFDWARYAAAHTDPATFVTGSREPFPEQFNTRVSDAGTGFHAAPVELDRQFLTEEGFPADSIAVVGNTVADVLADALTRIDQATVLDTYPQLASKKFIRMCIHRRENTEDETRFTTYFEAIELLLQRGFSILWVRLRGTDRALQRWGLMERLEQLQQQYPETLLVTEVWPDYVDVVASFLNYGLLATDSGSMQEEANILGVPCVTLRFGTDRGESLLAGGNVLAPPLSAPFVAEVIAQALAHRDDLVAEPLYGTNVADAIIDEVMARAVVGYGLFRTEEQVLRLDADRPAWPGTAAGRPLVRPHD